MRDSTITRYAAAAAALSPDTIRDAMTALERAAEHTDDAYDALPRVLCRLADDETETVAHAVRSVLSSVRKDRRERESAWEEYSTPVDESVSATIYAYDAPDQTEVLNTLSESDARILRAAIAPHAARHSGVWDGTTYSLPLRVKALGAAIGMSTRTGAASDRVRRVACDAFARYAVARGSAESVSAESDRAFRFVKRDRRAWNGNGQAIWQNDARPDLDVEYGLKGSGAGRRSFIAPNGPSPASAADPFSVNVGEGMTFGGGGAIALGDRDHLATEHATRATRKIDADERASAHRYDNGVGGQITRDEHGAPIITTSVTEGTFRDKRTGQERTYRYVTRTVEITDDAARSYGGESPSTGRPCPSALEHDATYVMWAECQCRQRGPITARTGHPYLVMGPGDDGLTAWCHPLTDCTSPTVRSVSMDPADGLTARCGCDRRAGILAPTVTSWGHRPDVRRPARGTI